MKRTNQKGFSMIELLGAIVILGIISLIAVTAVTKTTSNSRKDAYLSTVKIHKNTIEELINQEEYYVYDENTVYYFDYRLANEDQDGKSPYGEWLSAYVVVTYDGTTLHYYWTGIDSAGWRIDLKRRVEKLSRKDIYNSKAVGIIPGQEVEQKDNIVVYSYDEDGTVTEEEHEPSNDITEEEATECFSLEQLSDGTYSITGYNIACGKSVQIPSSIDGKRVTIIGENAFREIGIEEVSLYYGIKEIKNGAFQGNNINKLKLASSITLIGPYAFYKNQLPKIDLPEGLVEISTYGFANNKLTEVIFPKSLKTIGDRAFAGNLLTNVEFQSNPTISGASFANNKMDASSGIIYKYDSATGQKDYTTIIAYGGESKDVVIPEKVNGVAPLKIEASAFASNSLNSVVIPDSVVEIGNSAFYSNNLTSVTLPSNLQKIGSTAFRENKLTSIDIPDSVTSIGSSAFVRNCFPAGEDIIYARTASGIDYSTIVSGAGGKSPGNLDLVIPAEKNGVKLKSIVSSAFSCCYYNSVQMPNLSETDKLTVGTNVFYHNSFTDDQAWIYQIQDGVYDYSVLSSYGGKNRSGDLVIPGEKNGVALKTINASFTWTSCTSITIPASVTSMSNGIFGRSNTNNVKLTKLVNLTGREFDWYKLTSSSHPNPGKFVTGTVSHQTGDVVITDH